MIYKRRETRPGPPHCSSSLLGGWVGKQKRRRLSGRQSQRAPQHDLAAWARSALRFAAELRLAAGFHLSAPLSIHCLRYRFTSGCSAYASLTGLRLRRLTNVCGCLAPVRAPALKSVKRLLAMGHSNGSGAPTAIYLSPAVPSTFGFMRSIFTWQPLAIGLNGLCSHPFREGPASERARHTAVNCELPVKNRPVGGREPASSGEQLVGTG